ncbi:hypothetical protein Tco_1163123 [Tanacetum coccineum]
MVDLEADEEDPVRVVQRFLHLVSSNLLHLVVLVSALGLEFVLVSAPLELSLSQLVLVSAPLGLDLEFAMGQPASALGHLESTLGHLE